MDEVPTAQRLVVLSGPSGSGKGTITPLALEAYPQLRLAVSVTTRTPRAGELDDVTYHFWTVEQFTAAVEAGLFLEWAQVHQTLRRGWRRPAFEGGEPNPKSRSRPVFKVLRMS